MADPDKPGTEIGVVDPSGDEWVIPIEELPAWIAKGGRRQTDTEITEGQLQEKYGKYSIGAGLRDIADVGTFGGSTALLKKAGLTTTTEMRETQERSPVTSTVVQSAAMLLPGGTGKIANLAGKAAAAGVKGKAKKLMARGLMEGEVWGGQAAQRELALSAEPLNGERLTSVLSSKVLYGGFGGAAGGLVVHGLGAGLRKGKKLLDKAKDRLGKMGNKADDVVAGAADDVYAMDRKGLRTAKEAELVVMKKTKLTRAKADADDIYVTLKKHRELTRADDIYLAADKEGQALLGQGTTSNKIMKVMNKRKTFMDNTKSVLDALQAEEEGLLRVLDLKSELVASGRGAGFRASKLEAAEVALKKNRELFGRIDDLRNNKYTKPPKSQRMLDIEEAGDLLAEGGGKRGLVGAAIGMLPIPYGKAQLVGAVDALVSKKLGPAAAKVAIQVTDKVGKALVVAERGVQKATPVLAKATLAAASFGPAAREAASKSIPKNASLFQLYSAREGEIRAKTTMGPEGKIVMTPEARQDIAERIAAINESDPLLADQIETAAAARMEFLAERLPKKSDAPRYGGPDPHRPSDFEMRKWARYVAAVENPTAIIDRVGAGTITPEDAEALREVYPGMYQDIQQQITARIPELQKALPYKKRLALSILLGVPIDPAMDPRVLSILQGNFEQEEGTEGGMQAPTPKPQFGSIKKPDATAAQERAG